MKLEFRYVVILFALLFYFQLAAFAQLSPGELSTAHANLEGISNCTQCHSYGKKVTNEKCLTCHSEIDSLIKLKRGYHSSTEVKGKNCFACHSEHHGRSFDLNHFDKKKFNHDLAGYKLEGKHSKIECNECHKKEFISNQKQKKIDGTYLGMGVNCLDCHKDYHQKTLSNNCTNCHNHDAYKPAPKFDHNKTNFVLKGKHTEVKCIDCHKKEIKTGESFQNFANVPHQNCTNCHTDIHNNQFGQNCTKCHSEVSFHSINSTSKFDHNQTTYPLEGKHQTVDCKACHKTSYTTKLAYKSCTDCHKDYHDNQFQKNGKSPDCIECHTIQGFQIPLFTIEKHNELKFHLEGGHLATPCLECHKKQEKWSFRNIGERCVDCHQDEHKTTIDQKFYPNQNCEKCHVVTTWNKVSFNHNETQFKLEGVHSTQNCRACHYKKDETGAEHQQFSNLDSKCTNCHTDIHQQQFDKNGVTACSNCHGFENWKAEKFDHNNTRFKLDGGHEKVACTGCHKEVQTPQGISVKYRYDDIKCAVCH